MDRKIIAIVAVIVVVVAVFAAAAAIGDKHTDDNITYHSNGGHVIDKESDTSDFKTSSSTVIGEMYEKGYEAQFDWNTKADGTGSFVKEGDKVPSGVKDLYAWYSPYMTIGYGSKSFTDHVSDITVTVSGTYRGDTGYSLTVGMFNSPTYEKIAIPSDAKVTITDSKAHAIEVTRNDSNYGTVIFAYNDMAVALDLNFHQLDDQDLDCCTTTNLVADSTNHCAYMTFTPMDDCTKCLTLFAKQALK